MSKKQYISIFAIFFCLTVDSWAFALGNDLEKEFFKGVKEMETDYRRFEQEAFEEFKRELKAMWGDFVVSTKKDWVEYSANKTTRTRVDFKSGLVVVEVLVPPQKAERHSDLIKKKMTSAIEHLVIDRGKNRDYSLPQVSPSKKRPAKVLINKISPATLQPIPVLAGQLKNREGQKVTNRNKKEFAGEIIDTKPIVKEPIKTELGKMIKAQVKFSLIPDHLKIRAERYLKPVKTQARRFDVSTPLVFAVIHTESYFNPRAVSHAQAYGLMQLVPHSGAREAYRHVYGEDKILSADYLFDPKHNIELGCAYLGLLKNQYFRKIHRPQSALYCAVASYNTGVSNVSRALCGTRHLECALRRANSMTTEALFIHLKKHLPYRETRDYIIRVTDRVNLYQEWR